MKDKKIRFLNSDEEIMKIIKKAKDEQWDNIAFTHPNYRTDKYSRSFFSNIYKALDLKEDHLNELCKLNLRAISFHGFVTQKDQIKKVIKMPNLEALSLWDIGLKENDAKMISEHLKNLVHLSLWGNKVGAEGTISIARNLHNLRYLNLNQNQIGPEGASAIGKYLPLLSSLFLYNSNIGPDGVHEIAKGSHTLSSLDLSANQIQDDDITILTHAMPNLKFLSLVDNTIGPKGAFSIAKHLKNLYFLDLDSNSVGDDGTKIITENLSNLKSLNLNSNKIGIDGTSSIAKKLYSLSSINLSGNNISSKGALILANGLPKLRKLNLSFNHIGNEGIIAITNQMDSLISLNLGSNHIDSRGASSIANSSADLISLHLDYNRIGNEATVSIAHNQASLTFLDLSGSDINDEGALAIAENLTCLNTLNLSSNNIGSAGTSAIAHNLKNLSSLRLNSNNVGDDGASIIAQNIHSLFSLHLHRNQVSDEGASAISKNLSRLTTLDLGNNKISSDGASVIAKNLPHLSTLKLDINNIDSTGASAISQNLKALRYLDLSINKIEDEGAIAVANYSRFLSDLDLSSSNITDRGATAIGKNLSFLTYLNLGGNNIGPDGAIEIAKLKNLENLNLRYNNILNRGVFEITKKLHSLLKIDLSGNQIENEGCYSITTNLQKIRALSLENNLLSKFSKKFAAKPHLKELNLKYNSLMDPPQEIADQGLESIRNYYKQREAQGTVNLYESRLLIVGEPGAGKTSLMKKLLDENHQPQSHGEDSTTGVNVETGWTFPIEKPSDQHYQVNIWDFGGQEIQYATHQFFLSPRALYVLVIDDRKQHTPLDYWFNVIKLLGDGSPVVVVLNERDQCKITNYDHVRYHEFYKDHFAIHQGEVDLGEKDPRRFQALRSTFEKQLLELPHVGAKLPAKWKPIRLVLMAKAKKNTISLPDYREICVKHEIKDEGDQNVLLRYLHDLGVLLHFDDSSLADTLFLNPRWVLNAVYAVFQDKTVIENRGRFTKEWLFDHWEERDYRSDDCNKLLELMLRGRFELVYKLNDEQFIAPQLLPEVKSQFDWNDQHNLRFRFQYPFKLHGLISRLIVRCHSMIFEDTVWRKGVILFKNGAKALVEDMVSKRRGDKLIQINVTGPGAARKDLLDDIRSEIRSMHRSFKNLEVIEEVPIPQNPDLAVPYQFLLEQRYAGTTEFPWPDVQGKLSVSMLLEGLEERPTQEGGMSMKDHPNIVLNIDNSNTNTNQMHQSTKVDSQSQASASAQVDFDFTQQLGQLQGTLAELREELEGAGEQDAVDQLTAIETKLERLENLEPDADVKKQARGSLNKLKRLVTDLGDENSHIRKTVSKLSDGARIAKDLIGQYQGLAEGLGLPF